jgi:hypothetical protein
MLNVSERSVQNAAVVRDKGTPELQEAVAQGHLPVSVAANGFSGGQVGDLRSLPASQRTASDLIGSISPVTMWT